MLHEKLWPLFPCPKFCFQILSCQLKFSKQRSGFTFLRTLGSSKFTFIHLLRKLDKLIYILPVTLNLNWISRSRWIRSSIHVIGPVVVLPIFLKRYVKYILISNCWPCMSLILKQVKSVLVSLSIQRSSLWMMRNRLCRRIVLVCSRNIGS